MDWIIWVSIAALFIGVWHEINRFPATDKSFRDLMERLDELESENRSLHEKIDYFDEQVLSLSNDIGRLKDPEYFRALDDGDGHTLYELDKSRGDI